MWDWIASNKAWLFDGLGAGIVLALGTGAFALFRRFRPKPEPAGFEPTSLQQQAVPAPQSQPLATSGHPPRAAGITPNMVSESVKKAPPLQKASVKQRFAGIQVAWDTQLVDAEELEEGSVRLMLRTVEDLYFYVFCTVDLKSHPELAILPEDAAVRIRGKIDRADENKVYLIDAEIVWSKHNM